jgi:hypothetical protein
MESTTEVTYLTPQEVHERTGLALQTLANWRSTWPDGECKGPSWIKSAGRIGSPGGRVLYPEAGVHAYLAARSADPEPAAA